MRRKLDPNLSHAEIRAKILGGNATLSRSSRDRTRMVTAGNPDVIREAFDEPDAAQAADRPGGPRLKSGPAWGEGLRHWRAGGATEHHGGKMDTPDIGRKKVVTY
jgi:hypothetical protein